MNSTFFADTVSETLLIPLYMRAKESRRGEKAIIRDPVAERIAFGTQGQLYLLYDRPSLDYLRGVPRL